MCETCGVSAEQDEAARRVLHLRCAVGWYRRQGIDPSFWRDQGIEEYTDRRVAAAAGISKRYRAAHPGKSMTAAEFRTWVNDWLADWRRERDLASTRGC